MMKIKILSLCILWTTQSAWAITLQDAPIKKVTVYPNGALIERDIPVKAGERTINIEGLPANFDMSALKINSQNINVGAITHVDSALQKPAGRASTTLLKEIKNTEQKIAELHAQIQAAEIQNKFLTNLSSGQAATVRQQAYDAFLLMSQATRQKKDLEQRLAELNQDLNQVGDHHFKSRSIQIQVVTANSGQLKLSYQVSHATWKPSYKAELDSQTGKMKLTRMASISQKTGEDWENVQLSLSTNRPRHTIAQVSPEPWWVSFRSNEPEKRMMTKMAMASASPAPMQMEMANESATEEIMAFEQIEQGYSTQFITSTKASVPSSQQEIQLALDQQQLPVKVTTWIIPQQEEKAYLHAEFKRIDGDWPRGLIKLYRDNDYIGQRDWQNSHQDSNFFNFGEDERVQIKIRHPQDLQDHKGAFSKSITQNMTKQYHIQSRHRDTIEIRLFESIPQSQNDMLKVSHQFSQAPSSKEWQNQKNIYQWNTMLNPQQPFILDVDYEFKYPSEGGIPSGF